MLTYYPGTLVQTNAGTLLTTELQNLFLTGFPTNALFLFQGSSRANTLHLALFSFSDCFKEKDSKSDPSSLDYKIQRNPWVLMSQPLAFWWCPTFSFVLSHTTEMVSGTWNLKIKRSYHLSLFHCTVNQKLKNHIVGLIWSYTVFNSR